MVCYVMFYCLHDRWLIETLRWVERFFSPISTETSQVSSFRYYGDNISDFRKLSNVTIRDGSSPPPFPPTLRNIHIKNVRDWHIHFYKTFDQQIWTTSTYRGFDPFEPEKEATGDVIILKSRDSEKPSYHLYNKGYHKYTTCIPRSTSVQRRI